VHRSAPSSRDAARSRHGRVAQRKGIKLHRFKGPWRDERCNQARETTMGSRDGSTLAEVTLEDALRSDRIFHR